MCCTSLFPCLRSFPGVVSSLKAIILHVAQQSIQIWKTLQASKPDFWHSLPPLRHCGEGGGEEHLNWDDLSSAAILALFSSGGNCISLRCRTKAEPMIGILPLASPRQDLTIREALKCHQSTNCLKVFASMMYVSSVLWLLLFSSFFTYLTISRRLPTYEPGPAQGFSLLKGFSCHSDPFMSEQ